MSKDNIPELQVLSNFIGTWDVVSGSKENPAANGEYTTKWILDGRFVQTTGFVKTADGSNDFKITSLVTYDQQKKIIAGGRSCPMGTLKNPKEPGTPRPAP